MKKLLILLTLLSPTVYAQTGSIYEYNPKFDNSNKNYQINNKINNNRNVNNIKKDEMCPIQKEALEFNKKLRESNDIERMININ